MNAEKLVLSAINATIFTTLSVADAELLLSELPNILSLKYLEVEEILKDCPKVIEQLKNSYKSLITNETFGFWRNVNDYDNLLRILKSFEIYNA